MMTKHDLNRALGPTPPLFTVRVSDTLQGLKEEPAMKTKHIRRLLVAAVVTLVLAGAAYALVVTQGQDWYYNNRFTAYKGNEPEKQQEQYWITLPPIYRRSKRIRASLALPCRMSLGHQQKGLPR